MSDEENSFNSDEEEDYHEPSDTEVAQNDTLPVQNITPSHGVGLLPMTSEMTSVGNGGRFGSGLGLPQSGLTGLGGLPQSGLTGLGGLPQSGLGFPQSGLPLGMMTAGERTPGYGSLTPTLQQQLSVSSQTSKEPCDSLTWVAASNGHIPNGAVVGGWASSTGEPYYIARAKCPSDNSLCPGVVLKSTKVCYSMFQNQQQGGGRRGGRGVNQGQQGVAEDSNYEILVNKGNDISWVYTCPNASGGPSMYSHEHSSFVPQTAVKFHSASRNADYYWIRTISQWTGDVVPCVFMNNNFMYIENKSLNTHYMQSVNGFEVICTSNTLSGLEEEEGVDSIAPVVTSSIKNRYLYDINYNMDELSIDWSQTTLDEISLINKSTVEQTQIRPSFSMCHPTTFNWELSSPFKKVTIKGSVPFVFGGKDNPRIHLLNVQMLNVIINPTGTNIPGRVNNDMCTLHGGHLAAFTHVGGMIPLGGSSYMQAIPKNKMSDGIFAPITFTVDDLSQGITCEKVVSSNTTSFNVPPHSKLIVEQQGLQVSLSIPFKATLKTVYHNDSVEDEEVTGMYKYSSITTSFPAVVGGKTVM